MNRKLKVCLIFVGVFIAGAVSGGFLSFPFAKKHVIEKAGENFMIKRFLNRLDLTAEQKKQIDEISSPFAKRNAENRRQLGAEQQLTEQKILSILTPEQLRKFEELSANHREREQRIMRHLKAERKKFDEPRGNPPPASGAPTEPIATPAKP